MNPADAWVLNNRGLALLSLGKKGEAIESFSKALEIDPGLAAARGNLELARVGRACDQGRHDRAGTARRQ